MKYIIKESKINEFVSKYLDSQNWYTWDIGDGEFNLADGESGKDKFRFRIQNSSTVPDHEFNVIYISEDLITKIRTLFSIPDLDSIKMIIDWFNKKFDKKLTMDDFEWMEHNPDFDDEN